MKVANTWHLDINRIKKNMAKSFSIIDRTSTYAGIYGIESKNIYITGYAAMANIYAKTGLLLLGYGPSSEDILQHGFIEYMTPQNVWAAVVSEAVKIYTTDN